MSLVVGLAECVDGVHQDGELRRIDEWLNAMAEIENVTTTHAVSRQHCGHFLANAFLRCVQRARVEISLDRYLVADAAAGRAR